MQCAVHNVLLCVVPCSAFVRPKEAMEIWQTISTTSSTVIRPESKPTKAIANHWMLFPRPEPHTQCLTFLHRPALSHREAGFRVVRKADVNKKRNGLLSNHFRSSQPRLFSATRMFNGSKHVIED